jgi:hypothetical protein
MVQVPRRAPRRGVALPRFPGLKLRNMQPRRVVISEKDTATTSRQEGQGFLEGGKREAPAVCHLTHFNPPLTRQSRSRREP